MEFTTLAKDRFSVRTFSNQPIEDEKLDRILDMAKYAPTAVNFQPHKVYVIKSPEALAKVNSVCKCIYGAPVVLLVCYDKNISWKNPLSGEDAGVQDVSIVTTHMMLEAWNQGIGSCWVGMYDSNEVKDAFNLPENIVPVCMLPIGYAAEGTKPREIWHNVYKPVDEIIVNL